jgi:hypothetical protein
MPLRRQSDDELYNIHGKLLGFKRSDGGVYTFPFPVDYKSIVPFIAVFLVTLFILNMFGVGGLWRWLWSIGAGVIFCAVMSKVTGPERPLSVVLFIVWHEICAPRPQEKSGSTARLQPAVLPVSPSRIPRKGRTS